MSVPDTPENVMVRTGWMRVLKSMLPMMVDIPSEKLSLAIVNRSKRLLSEKERRRLSVKGKCV